MSCTSVVLYPSCCASVVIHLSCASVVLYLSCPSVVLYLSYASVALYLCCASVVLYIPKLFCYCMLPDLCYRCTICTIPELCCNHVVLVDHHHGPVHQSLDVPQPLDPGLNILPLLSLYPPQVLCRQLRQIGWRAGHAWINVHNNYCPLYKECKFGDLGSNILNFFEKLSIVYMDMHQFLYFRIYFFYIGY